MGEQIRLEEAVRRLNALVEQPARFSLQRMLQEEADDICKMKFRHKMQDAIAEAYERMMDWYNKADSFGFEITDPLDVAQFVASHRQTCAVMVLLGKAQAQNERKDNG